MSLDANDFDQAVERYHLALDEFMKGNPAPAKKLYSQRDDVTLGNPFGPFVHGWKQVVEAMEQAASNYRDGDATGFENIAKCVTSELAYLVEVERLRSKIGGRSDVTPLALRVTSVFRPEDGLWKIVCRQCRSDNDGSAGRFGTPPIDAEARGQLPGCGPTRLTLMSLRPNSPHD